MFFKDFEKKAVEYRNKQKSKESQGSSTTVKPILSRQKATEEVEPADSNIGHIMISYNKLSRDTCLKIKEKLDVSNNSARIKLLNLIY